VATATNPRRGPPAPEIMKASCHRLCHYYGMKTAIDAAGRVVVPKVLRDELGFHPGLPLEIHTRDGALVIEPVPTPVKLVRRGKVMVAKPVIRLPTLTQEQVRAALEGLRR
jgi:AbrB family looped-hinge helix DNA binding protein